MKRNSAFWGVVVVALAGALAVGISFTTEAEAARFVDNQDGTITDNQTGLMWEKKMPGGSGQNCVENLHGVKALCDWNTAMSEWLSRMNGLSDEADGSDQKGLGGYTDWRLPTQAELKSLLDSNAGSCGGSEGPCIDAAFAPTGTEQGYWSATTATAFPKRTWAVHFGHGFLGTPAKSVTRPAKATPYGKYVRAVRGAVSN